MAEIKLNDPTLNVQLVACRRTETKKTDKDEGRKYVPSYISVNEQNEDCIR